MFQHGGFVGPPPLMHVDIFKDRRRGAFRGNTEEAGIVTIEPDFSHKEPDLQLYAIGDREVPSHLDPWCRAFRITFHCKHLRRYARPGQGWIVHRYRRCGDVGAQIARRT